MTDVCANTHTHTHAHTRTHTHTHAHIHAHTHAHAHTHNTRTRTHTRTHACAPRGQTGALYGARFPTLAALASAALEGARAEGAPKLLEREPEGLVGEVERDADSGSYRRVR